MSNTVILGAGIIGVSTAYYLSDHQPGSTIHLVEPSAKLFDSASGFAGGFLARDWFARPVAAVGALSFDEHRRLADAHGGRARWGYSPSTAISYTYVGADKVSRKRGEDWLRDGTSRAGATSGEPEEMAADKAPGWVRRVDGDRAEQISVDGTTAQVDPLALCQFLLKECQERGVQLHHPAKVLSVRKDMHGELASVRIADTTSSTETEVPCSRIIITAGAWSGQVFDSLFPEAKLKLPVSPLAGHSILVKSPRWTKELEEKGCHALFTTSPDKFSPELISRIGGCIYFAGLNSATIPLPKLPDDRKVQTEDIELLVRTAKELLGPGSGESDLEILRESLCFRPITDKGTPYISRIDDDQLGAGITTRAGPDGGVFIGTGHGPWGISLCLGTGLVLAEMAQGRPLSADVSALALR